MIHTWCRKPVRVDKRVQRLDIWIIVEFYMVICLEID